VPTPADLYRVAAGRTSPETLAWSSRLVTNRIRVIGPDLIVSVSTRAYHPTFRQLAPVVLDYVDSLAGSYRQRSDLAGSSVKGLAYAALASMHHRIEQPGRLPAVRRVAAGLFDAETLAADWFPIIAWDFRETRPETADHDFVFVGNLGYLPNVAALRFLSSAWPEFRSRLPRCTLLVAGRHPPPQVTALAARHGWTLVPDFQDIFDVLGRGLVSLAPVEHLSGISTKVLDSAAMGVAQVVTTAALRGVAPGFPAVVADGQAGFSRAAVDLLIDEPRRRDLARAGRAEMQRSYSIAKWQPWVRDLLSPSLQPHQDPDPSRSRRP